MAPKKKASSKAKTSSPLETFLAKLPKTEVEYFEMLARRDQAQIKGDGSSLDDLFINQRERNLRKAEALKATK